ncbi:MAG: CPBP family intramembrane glutamic endopeptidase [Parasphingorhabdus sp.]|uniref:CPBP family intramembrane glutamic endopeptidase n=1 Tax=Parasphingorhabdus sp. TaxID=2709688 RepID=UPI003296DA98
MLAFVAATQFMGLAADYFFEDVGTSGRFDHIEGNLTAYIGIMLLVWTHGSFFEELLFRAFVIDRSSHFLGGGLKADLTAALISSVFFGYRHYCYQGMHGALITGAGGFVFAVFYLWFGRKNIVPLNFCARHPQLPCSNNKVLRHQGLAPAFMSMAVSSNKTDSLRNQV